MKQFRTYCLLALCGVAFYSCKKEISTKPQGGIPDQTIYASDTISFRPLDMTPEELLAFPDDLNYETIDMARYSLGLALTQHMTHDIAQYIYDHTVSIVGEDGVEEEVYLKFDNLFAEFPGLANDIDNYLASHEIPGVNGQYHDYGEIKDVMTRNGIVYDLVINVPNRHSTGGVDLPIVSAGVELQLDDEAGDQIQAWHIAEAGVAEEIRLTENEATLTSKPIFNISLQERNASKETHDDPPTSPSHEHPWLFDSYRRIYISSIRIYKRFEKSARSEVNVCAYYRTAGTNSLGNPNAKPVYGNVYNNNSTYKQIAKIHKDHMGTWFIVNDELCKFLPHPSPILISCSWNTFERDWWESNKIIGEAKGMGVRGDMTFADESYFYRKSDCHEGSQWYIQEANSVQIWNANGSPIFGTGLYHSEMEFKKQ